MTSPIFWPAFDSVEISSLVVRASPTALRTMSVAITIWRLISVIEPLSSSAAAAEVSTLVEASLDAVTALCARSEVWPELLSRPVAVVRMSSAVPVTARN